MSILANKSKVENQRIPHPQWVAGFSSGEGCFSVAFSNDLFQHLSFKLTQPFRDTELLKSFINYFGYGYYYPSEIRGYLKISSFSSVKEIIIPFLSKILY